MATVIDELLVTLGLDPKGFKKGAQEVTDAEKQINKTAQETETKRKRLDKDQGERQRKNAKESERHNKQQIESFNKIKHQLLGIMGAYIGLRSLKSFAMNAIFDESALGRLSDVVDMSANKIAAYGLAFKSMGGDAKEASGEILKAQNVLGAMRIGQAPGAYQAFLRYGGQVGDMRSTGSYLMGISRILQHLQSNPRLRASMPYVANQLGVGYNLMQVLKQGPGAVSRMLAQYEKVTNVTRDQIKRSEELQKTMAVTEEAWKNTGRILLNDVNPYLIQFFNHLKQFSGWMTAHAPEIKGAIDTGAHFFGWFDPTTKQSGLRQSWDNVLGIMLSPFGYDSGGHIQSETHIGKIEVHTQATDANGIANGIGSALKKQTAIQANSGVN